MNLRHFVIFALFLPMTAFAQPASEAAADSVAEPNLATTVADKSIQLHASSKSPLGFTEILAIGLGITIPFGALAYALLLRHKQRMAREATLRLAIEKGDALSAGLVQLVRQHMEEPDGRNLPSAVFIGSVLIGIGCFFGIRGGTGTVLFYSALGAGFIARAYLSTRTVQKKAE